MVKPFFRKIIPLRIRLDLHQLAKFKYLLTPARNLKAKFIIYGMGRAGSTLLTDLLNNSNEIYCAHEILSRDNINQLIFPFSYLEANTRIALFRNKNVYGCGIMSHQLQHLGIKNQEKFIKNLVHRNWKIIHIRRDNIFNVVVSIIRAEKDQQWEIKDLKKLNNDKYYINPERFKYFVNVIIHYYKLEDKLLSNIPHIKVNYETDLRNGNWDKKIHDIFNYLNVKNTPLKTKLVKKTTTPYDKQIKNYLEIKRIYNEIMTMKENKSLVKE
jgi:LPS sulfotransferase NodH